MNAYEYVPSDDQVRGRYCDGTYVQTGHTTDGDEFDAWLARVRRDAWDEGEKAGYVHGQHDAHHFDPGPDYHETPNPYHGAQDVRDYRDAHYPEGADSD